MNSVYDHLPNAVILVYRYGTIRTRKEKCVTVSDLLMCSLHTGSTTTAQLVHVKNGIQWCGCVDGWMTSEEEELTDLLFFFSSLLGSSFPRNPLTYQKGGFLEILFLGAGLIINSMYTTLNHNYVW